MKIETTNLDRALALARRMVEAQACRCARCGQPFDVRSETVMLSGAEPLFRREVANLRFECPACKTRNPLPWGFEQELAGRLEAGERPPTETARDICPDCGAHMEPNGRCFVCRGCGHSTCG